MSEGTRVTRHLPAYAAIPVSALLVAGCAAAESPTGAVGHDPAHVEEVAGSEVDRVVLEPAAAVRLGISTVPVRRSARGTSVPAAAIFVDPEGRWWVYTNPEPHVFVRHEIRIDHEREDRVFLEAGPVAGVEVVTVGVPELYGVEDGMAH